MAFSDMDPLLNLGEGEKEKKNAQSHNAGVMQAHARGTSCL